MTDLLDPPALRADVVPGTVTGAATIHRRRWWTLAVLCLSLVVSGSTTRS
jgi:hypothetical protein